MFKVEGIKRGSPEVMYGEGKKEGRFPRVRTQEEVRRLSLFFSVFKVWLSVWPTQPSASHLA